MVGEKLSERSRVPFSVDDADSADESGASNVKLVLYKSVGRTSMVRELVGRPSSAASVLLACHLMALSLMAWLAVPVVCVNMVGGEDGCRPLSVEGGLVYIET